MTTPNAILTAAAEMTIEELQQCFLPETVWVEPVAWVRGTADLIGPVFVEREGYHIACGSRIPTPFRSMFGQQFQLHFPGQYRAATGIKFFDAQTGGNLLICADIQFAPGDSIPMRMVLE